MRVPQVSERIKEAPAQALRGVFAGIGQLLLITDKIRNKASHQDVPRARTPEASETVTDTPVTSPAGQANGTAAAPAAPAAEGASAPSPAGAGPAGTGPAAAGAAGPAPAKPAAAKPAATRRTAAKPVADKPVTAKPPSKPAAAKPVTAKPVTAKPVTAKPVTPRRTAAKAAAAEAGGEAAPKPPKRQSSRNFDKTGNVRMLGDEADTPAVSAAPEPATAAEPPAAEPAAAAPEPVAVAPEAEAAAEPVAAAAPLPNYDELSVASLRARLRNLDVAQVRQLAEYERAHAARADMLTMFERRIAKLEAEA
jgi:hypothetical protein